MNRLTLSRHFTSNQGTLGELASNGGAWPTLELPWRNNAPQVSCIPCGEYLCRLVRSPRFGQVYQVMNVPGRTHILIHAGNYAGDVSRGYLSHSHGCILIGSHVGRLGEQTAVLASKRALRAFVKAMRGQDFELKIRDGNGFCG